MRLWHIVPVVALLSFQVGCSKDEPSEPAGQTAPVNGAAAKQSAQSAISAAVAAKQGQGASSVTSLLGVGSSAFSLLLPSPGGGAGTTSLASLTTAPAGAFLPGEAGLACGDTSCSFDGYSPGGSFTVDGSMSWGDDHLVADLTVAMAQGGVELDFRTTADLTFTGSSLDGTVTSKGKAVSQQAKQYGSSGEIEWDASLEYRDLTFASGQPTGGSLVVHVSMRSGEQSYQGDLNVSFP
jgi:hypothetical protein